MPIRQAFLPPHDAIAPHLLSWEQEQLAHFIRQSREDRERIVREAEVDHKTPGELIALMRYLRTL